MTRYPSIKNLILYFIYLGGLCFGGPIVLVGQMQSDLVEKKKWFSKEEFLDGLAFSQLAPGPLAVQLGMYLGYIRFGIWGATITLFSFILPPTLIVIVISYFYTKYSGLGWIQAFLYGISPCVIAIIFKAVYKLLKITIDREIFLSGICFCVCILSLFFKLDPFLPILLFGLFYSLLRNKQSKKNFLFAIVPAPPLLKLFFFFFKIGALVFGGGYAVIPFLYKCVKDYHWITEKQFLDAVSIGMITPGPILVCVTFIGYLIKGLNGALISTIAIFLPVYIYVCIFSSIFKKVSKSLFFTDVIKGITAGVCGAIFSSCITLLTKSVIDIPTLIIGIISMFLLARFKDLPNPVLILFFGIAGILIKHYLTL